METYRMSSKLREQEREYLIQTANDSALGAIATTIYVDGAPAETVHCPHPQEIAAEEILTLVKATHYEKKQEIELLLQTYRRLLQECHPLTMHQYAVALYHKGFYFEAQELLTHAVRMNPDGHQSYNQLGLTELALGHPREALTAASKAVELRPNFADYRNHLGEALMACGDPTRAIEQFEQAVSINLYYADAYFNLGLARLQLAMQNSAPEHLVARVADAFRKACLIYPDYAGQAFESAVAGLKEHDFARAYNIFLSIRDARKEGRRQELAAVYLRANLMPEHFTERSVQERISVLNGQVSRYPMYPDLQAELGHAYLEMAKLSSYRAVQHLKKAVELNPTLPHNVTALDRAEEVLERLEMLLGTLSQKG